MKKTLILSLLTVLLSTVAFSTQAQSNPQFTFNVIQLAQPTPNLLDTMWVKKYSLVLVDTNTIDKLHLKMGTTLGGTEIFDHTFDFDPSTSLPTGFTYQRDSSSIIMTVGAYHAGFYYYEATIEDTAQNVSTVQRLNSNQHTF